jgi:hypothetical protein
MIILGRRVADVFPDIAHLVVPLLGTFHFLTREKPYGVTTIVKKTGEILPRNVRS